ncbi:hypothetical protein ABPG74_016026 [Tetrahymena malaccensis]
MSKERAYGQRIPIHNTIFSAERTQSIVQLVTQFEYIPEYIKPYKKLILEENIDFIKFVVECLHSILKYSEYHEPQIQFNSMRLLKQFIELFSEQFQYEVEKQLLDVLAEIVKQNLKTGQENGQLFFIKQSCVQNKELRYLGQHYILLILECLQIWSIWFKNSKYEQVYNDLKNYGIKFPQSYVYFSPTQSKMTLEQVQKEMQLAKQKYDPQPIQATKEQDKKEKVIEKADKDEKTEKQEKDEKQDKADKKDKDKEKDKDKDKDKDKEKDKEKEKELEKTMLLVSIPEDKKTNLQKLSDYLFKQQEESQTSYYNLRSNLGSEDSNYSGYSNFDYNISFDEYYRKYQLIKTSLKLIEQGFVPEPYAFVYIPYRMIIYRILMQSFDNDYLDLFLEYLYKTLFNLLEYQQKYYKSQKNENKQIISCFNQRQSSIKNYYVELANALVCFNSVFNNKYSLEFEGFIAKLKNTDSLFFCSIADSTIEQYKTRKEQTYQQRAQQQQDKLKTPNNMLSKKQLFLERNQKVNYKRKMQILQNKIVAFQYFTKESISCFEIQNFQLSSKKKHVIYIKVVELNDVFKILEDQEKQNYPLHDKELRFILSRVQINYDKKYENENIILTRVSFKNCSTHLIQNFMQLNITKIQCLPKSLEIINCAINDIEFKEILKQIELLNDTPTRSYQKYNMKFRVEGCRNLSYLFLENFNHSVEKWNQLQEIFQTDRQAYWRIMAQIRLKLILKNSVNFKLDDILKLSTYESFRGVSALKLKKLDGENMDQAMSYLLSNRLIFTKDEIFSDQVYYQSQLKGVSFDSSVCSNFEDLNLHEEYFSNLNKLSFKCTSQSKQSISFSKMRSYSLKFLKVLKFKNCILTSEFFQNLSSLNFPNSLKNLNFQNCQFDNEDLNNFLKTTDLNMLEVLNLSNTNIDDNICYQIYISFSQRTNFKQLDISNNQSKKLTHKGIKYLTYIQCLENLNISNCSKAIDDTLSIYLHDLIRRKNKLYKSKYVQEQEEYRQQLQSFLDQKCRSQKPYIEQCEKDIQQAEQTLEEIRKQKQQFQQKIAQKDYEDYFNPNDSNIYLHMIEFKIQQYIQELEEAIVLMKRKEISDQDQYKLIYDKIKELDETKLNFNPKCSIESIDLSGNQKITSVFFEQFYKTDYLEKVFYLNLSKTSVCGEIFNYIHQFDDCKDYKGENFQRNDVLIKKGTLEEDEDLDNIAQEDGTLINIEEIKEEEEENSSKDKQGSQKEITIKQQEGDQKSIHSNKANQVATGEVKNNQQEEIKQQEQKNLTNNQIPKNTTNQIKSVQNVSQEFENVNECLEVLILSQCKNIKSNKFMNLFNTVFHNLQELNLNNCYYCDREMEEFIKNKQTCFSHLKILNIQYSNITNEAIWKLLQEDKQLIELYLDYSNLSINPFLNRQVENDNQNNQKSKGKKLQQLKVAKGRQEGERILPSIFVFSATGCKLWEDSHLLEILELISSSIFDFNYFLGCYRHLITKKLVYYIIQEYQLLKKYFYFNISGAALPDIEESEKYQEEAQQLFQRFFNKPKKQIKKTSDIQQHYLETIVVDNSRINYKLFTKIIKYHPSIKYISCSNTPYLHPLSVAHKKKTSEDVLNIDQLMYLINQKSISLQERHIQEIFIQVRKIKEEEKRTGTKGLKKSKKLILNGNQNLSSQTIDKIIFELFPYLNSLYLQYTKVESTTIMQIVEKGNNIEYIGLKGCIHLSKEVLISICKSKNLSKHFRLECVLEMKHLIDYEVLIAFSQSRYMSNILCLDLSDIKLPNMDDCIMSICFVAQDISINLRIINVQNTLISDRGFQMISVSQKFKNLERIYFKDCPLITERGISFIVDSNNLTRFDLNHFLNQNSGLLNGRIIDTLKYSNRKIFFREINFQESSISDKELQKLLNETLNNTFATKMFDFRFTPNLTSEGIKSVYNIYQRTTRKKQEGKTQEEEQIQQSQLEMILLDDRRNRSLFANMPNYVDIFNKMLDQFYNNKEQALNIQQQVSTPAANPQTKAQNAQAQDKNKQQKNQQQNNQAVQPQNQQQATKPKNNQISQTYEESEINQWKDYILRDDPYVSLNYEENLKKDNIMVDIFLYYNNFSYFKYDYFLKKHKQLIDDNILTAFSLVKYFAQKKVYQKNFIDSNNANNKGQDEAEAAAFTESMNFFKNQSFQRIIYIDLSYNTSISEQAFCRFFLNCQFLNYIKTINLSGTKATEKVIDAIIISKQIKQLSFIQLDNCQYLKDINYVLNKVLDQSEKKEQTTVFNIRKFFFYYIKQINDETLARYLKLLQERKIKAQCLNLENSKISGIFFKYSGCFQKIRVLNLSNTYFSFSYLNEIAKQKNCMKTIWVDRTYQMADKVLRQLIDKGEFTLFTDIIKPQNEAKKLRIEEFLYSIGPELNISLNSFLKTSLLYFKQKNLNLNYFPQIDPLLLADILNSNNIKHFKQICLDFKLNCQIPAFKKILNLIYQACKNSELYCFKTDKISIKYQIDIQYFMSQNNINLENLDSIEKQKEYQEKYKYVFEKVIIDPSITSSFPFIVQESIKDIELYYNQIQNQQLDLDGRDKIIKPIPKIQNAYYSFLFQPFQFTELDLSSTFIERKSFRLLIKLLRNENSLLKLNLTNQKLIYDQDIIKYLIKKNGLNQFCFKYLEVLKVIDTNVTQRSLCSVLKECPFSSSFNITELIDDFVQNFKKNKFNVLNNSLIESLMDSPYLLNIKNLDLKDIPITDNMVKIIFSDKHNINFIFNQLQQLLYSKYAVNIEKMQINYEFVSNSTFIGLASTKKLPLLKSFYIDNDAANCKTNLHYIFRAKNLNFDFDMSQIVFENNFMFQQVNYIMSMIESAYMLKQKTLVMKSIQENIENINQLFKLSPYLQNIQVIHITSLDDRDAFYPIWVNLAKTNKLPNLVDLTISKVLLHHLKILLVQENKPKLDLSKLLYENGDIVDDECLKILSNQPNLLNMEVLDLSQLRIIQNGISSSSLLELALSKYVGNIKKIIIYEDQEKVQRATLPKLEDKLQKKLNKHKKIYEIYEQNGEEMNVSKDEVAKHQGDFAGIYEDMLLTNNFSNLESIEFKGIECIHPLYVLYTSHRVKKRFYSPKFNLDDFYVQISNYFADELSLDDQQRVKKRAIIQIFNLFYEVDKSFYTKRHKVLKMAPFIVFNRSNFNQILNRLEHLSLIEELNIKLVDDTQNILYALRYCYRGKYLLNIKKINFDTDQHQTYYFSEYYFTEFLINIQSSIVNDQFQFSPFFYKTVIPLRRETDSSIDAVFHCVIQYPKIAGSMKDLVLFLEDLNVNIINDLFQNVKQFKCKQLILKRSYNNSESKGDNLKTLQDNIINHIITKQSLINVKRFKPVQPITFKQFIELINIDFFHSSVNIFEFYKNYVEQSESAKPKFSEVLQLLQFKNYYQLEELVIPNFEIDVNNNGECELSQFKIIQMSNLKELKIQYLVSQADLEYLFNQVYLINNKLKVTFSSIQDEILVNLFTPPKIELQQKASATKQNITENDEKEQQIQYQENKEGMLKILSYTYDQKGKDWTYVLNLINQHLNQLDEQKKMIVYENINQNSSRYYLPKLQITPQILFNKELTKLNVNKLYYPNISITEPKYTSSIQIFIGKLDCLHNVSIQGENDFNFSHLLPLFEKCYSTQLFEDIFEHSSSQITYEDIAKIPTYIFFNMNYLCLKKNKFILNEKTIETIQYQKKRFFLDDAGGQKKNKKKKQQKQQSQGNKVEEDQQQNQNIDQDENNNENQADNQLKEKNESSSGSDSDIDGSQSEDGKDNVVAKAEKEVEEEEEQRINDEDLMDQKKWFTKETLANFLSKFIKLKRINFGDTQIAGEHFNSIGFNNLHYKLEHIDLDNCKVQNPTVFLTSFLQSWDHDKGEAEPRLQLQRFISQISFTNNFPSNVEFVKELMDSQYFKEHVKYLNLLNLIKLHEQNGKELMKILSQILKRGDNIFCITSFLITMGDIRNKLSDIEFDLITRSYNQIQYLSPLLFNNVYQGFNHIIQHTSVSPKSKVMYFLSTNFQRYISGCSFYEILYLIFDEDDLINNGIIYEHFQDIVEGEFEKLENLFEILLKILDSFIENQVGISNFFFNQIQSHIEQLKQVVSSLNNEEFKGKIQTIYNELPNYQNKYLAIADIYQQSTQLKIQKSQSAGNKMRSSIRMKTTQNKFSQVSSLTKSFFQKGQNQNLKNLQERGLSEKKLQQYEHQIIVTIQYIIQMCQKMKKTFDYNELCILLEFVETLNFGNNSFLNFKGFNNYIKSHISPWLAMNKGIQKLKVQGDNVNSKLDLSTKNLKILVKQSKQEDDDDNETKRNNLENLIESDNELDDTIFDHLCLFIQKRMKGLRYINLSGVNISDIFAEKFSLILSDEEQLRNLVKLDLTNNRRLSAFGMKYLYAAIVDRIHKGFRLEISSTFAEVQSLKARVTALETKIENLDDKTQQNERLQKIDNEIAKQNKIKSKSQITEDNKQNLQQSSKSKTQIKSQVQIINDNLEEAGKLIQTKDKNLNSISPIGPTQNLPNETVQLLEKYQSQNIDKKDRKLNSLLEEYTRFQEYLKKCSEQVDKYDRVNEQVDLMSFMNNVTNIGLFDSINSFVLRNWRTHYFVIIMIGLIMFPLTIFHITQVLLIRVNTKISTYTFSPDFIYRIFKKKDYTILVDKKVPESITSQDFYFDKDVAILDQVISGKNVSISDQALKSKLTRVKQFLENPTQDSFHNIKKGLQTEKTTNLLKYLDYVVVFNIVVFQLFLSIAYPFIIENSKDQNNCDKTSSTQDIPIYVYLFVSCFIELILLRNLEQIIGSQQIFTTSSLSVISLLSSSVMARYDIYTDVCFGIQITFCEKLNSQDLGAYCLALAALNMSISIYMQRNCIARIMDYRKRKAGEIHNTAFINVYTKLTLVQEMNAFGTVLDRFSTTAIQTFEKPIFKFSFMQGIIVPQVIISKFIRAFIEDIPQIFIILFYQFRQKGSSQISFGSWQYLRVILSSLLSLFSALSQTWHAKPSIFKTYMFSEYIGFIQKGENGYKINVTYKNFSQSYTYEQIYAKIKAYMRVYPISSQSSQDQKKKAVMNQIIRQQSQSVPGNNESQSQLQDNLSQDQSVNITSNHTLRSAMQSEAVSTTQRRQSLTSQRNNDDALSERSVSTREIKQKQRTTDYQSGLIHYLCTDGLTPEEFWKCVDYFEDQQSQIEKAKQESNKKTKTVTAK